jgi:hypothetical protein
MAMVRPMFNQRNNLKPHKFARTGDHFAQTALSHDRVTAAFFQ